MYNDLKIVGKKLIANAYIFASFILFIVTLFLMYISSRCMDPKSYLSIWLSGASTNLVGIIITLTFVRLLLYQKEKVDLKLEQITTIRKYNNILSMFIKKYILYFNCVATVFSNRIDISDKSFVELSDIIQISDLYMPLKRLDQDRFAPVILSFLNQEKVIRNCFIQMYSDVASMENHQKLEIILREFITISTQMDMRDAILKNCYNTRVGEGNIPYTDFIRNIILENGKESYNQYKSGNLSGNILVPYFVLFDMLRIEKELIVQYQDYVDGVFNNIEELQ